MSDKVTALDVKKALAGYHCKDFYITECKNGSTYFAPPQGLLKFDALAISKSWTSPRIRIYEIKVSRNDFKQDGKWHLYKQYCHEFCFACPKGLIRKEELPDDVGLVYFNPENGAVRQVKKPLYRSVEYDANMLMYIIMNRLDDDRIPFYGDDRTAYARDYLANKADKRSIGHRLGSQMARDLTDLQDKLKRNERAQEAIDTLREIERMLQDAGHYVWRWNQVPKEIEKLLTSGDLPEMENIKIHIQGLQHELEKIEARSDANGKKNGADNTDV